MRSTATFNKEFQILFWNVSEAREIIKNTIDSFTTKNNWYQASTSEENHILYTSFLVTITGKDAEKIKEFSTEIKNRLIKLEKAPSKNK